MRTKKLMNQPIVGGLRFGPESSTWESGGRILREHVRAVTRLLVDAVCEFTRAHILVNDTVQSSSTHKPRQNFQITKRSLQAAEKPYVDLYQKEKTTT